MIIANLDYEPPSFERMTMGELSQHLHNIYKIEDQMIRQETADVFMEAFREFSEYADSNVGYIIGYSDPDIAQDLYELFSVQHPILGKNLDPSEAFKAGKEYASRLHMESS